MLVNFSIGFYSKYQKGNFTMYTFHVPKMSCGGCVNSIKNAIKKIDGDALVETDLSTKTVTIETTISDTVIVKAMTDAGYPPML
jgi:copper chaperone